MGGRCSTARFSLPCISSSKLCSSTAYRMRPRPADQARQRRQASVGDARSPNDGSMTLGVYTMVDCSSSTTSALNQAGWISNCSPFTVIFAGLRRAGRSVSCAGAQGDRQTASCVPSPLGQRGFQLDALILADLAEVLELQTHSPSGMHGGAHTHAPPTTSLALALKAPAMAPFSSTTLSVSWAFFSDSCSCAWRPTLVSAECRYARPGVRRWATVGRSGARHLQIEAGPVGVADALGPALHVARRQRTGRATGTAGRAHVVGLDFGVPAVLRLSAREGETGFARLRPRHTHVVGHFGGLVLAESAQRHVVVRKTRPLRVPGRRRARLSLFLSTPIFVRYRYVRTRK
jgi:hypothetical protein